MRKVKTIFKRPWLTSTGVEISTPELREISKSWEPATWAAYLDWFETPQHEHLVTPAAYQTICDEQTESIFEQFAQEISADSKKLCEQGLKRLSDNQSTVLRKVFLEGRTTREIATEVGRPKSTIHDLKYKGILSLKRGIDGKNSDTRRFMRGKVLHREKKEPSIWSELLAKSVIEDREYDPANHAQEFENINLSSFRAALLDLSANAKRILYLRYWCKFSLNKAARVLCTGVNNIEQIEASSITKLKRRLIALETGNQFGGAK